MSNQHETKKVSRRDLMKGAAIGAAGVAATGMLSGCEKEQVAIAPPSWPSDVPEHWDREVEMLILGVGIAGACAAVEAHDLGVEVLAIEKRNEIRGTCSISGGAICGAGTRQQKKFGIYDDVEGMIEDVMNCGDELGDPEVIRAFAELSGNTIDWLEDLGCKLMPGVRPFRDIHRIDRSHNSYPPGSGLGWMLGLESAIQKRGIEVEFETTVTRLYRQASGRVVGAQVKSLKDGATRNYRATKGVLLSMGGLGNNVEMWEKYSPVMKEMIKKAKKIRGVYPAAAQGDGIPIAMDAGAYLYPQPATYAAGGVELNSDGFTTGSLLPYRWGEAGAIGLNANGKRFWNETSFTDFYVTKKFKHQPGLWSIFLFDDEVRQGPSGQLYAQPIIDKVLANGHNTVQQADTIEELAEKFGIPAAAARKTVDDWNSLVEAGGSDELTGRTVMGPKILKPPFWGIEIIASFGLSKGGSRINPKAQVMDRNYNVIPGLYAAGEMAYFQVHGSARVHVPGGCNGTGANFGRIAARNIAKEEVQA